MSATLGFPPPGTSEPNMPCQKGSRVVLISGKDKKGHLRNQTAGQTHTHTKGNKFKQRHLRENKRKPLEEGED